MRDKLEKALTPEELEFYLNARIAYNDQAGWRRLLRLQDKAMEHQDGQ